MLVKELWRGDERVFACKISKQMFGERQYGNREAARRAALKLCVRHHSGAKKKWRTGRYLNPAAAKNVPELFETSIVGGPKCYSVSNKEEFVR